jgi:hypothetical protein
LAILAATLSAPLALAKDFKTVNRKHAGANSDGYHNSDSNGNA